MEVFTQVARSAWVLKYSTACLAMFHEMELQSSVSNGMEDYGQYAKLSWTVRWKNSINLQIMNSLSIMKVGQNYSWNVAVITLATKAAWVGACGASVLLFWPSESGFSSWFGRIEACRPMWAEWFRIDVTHISTWKCKKLFQVYLKNKSYNQKRKQWVNYFELYFPK